MERFWVDLAKANLHEAQGQVVREPLKQVMTTFFWWSSFRQVMRESNGPI